MGNWIGRSEMVLSMVLSMDYDKLRSEEEDDVKAKSPHKQQPKSGLRIKVRMSKKELKELMEEVDLSKGNTEELGRLILQKCMEGKLSANVVPGEAWVSKVTRDIQLLTTIVE